MWSRRGFIGSAGTITGAVTTGLVFGERMRGQELAGHGGGVKEQHESTVTFIGDELSHVVRSGSAVSGAALATQARLAAVKMEELGIDDYVKDRVEASIAEEGLEGATSRVMEHGNFQTAEERIRNDFSVTVPMGTLERDLLLTPAEQRQARLNDLRTTNVSDLLRQGAAVADTYGSVPQPPVLQVRQGPDPCVVLAIIAEALALAGIVAALACPVCGAILFFMAWYFHMLVEYGCE